MFVVLSSGMLRKNNYIKINKQRYLLLESVLNYCLFVLFVFFFAFGQPSALASSRLEESLIHKNFTCHLSEDLISNSHYPSHLPFESAPTPNEPEASDEDGQEDNFDDDLNPLIWKDSSEGIFDISSSVANDFFQIIPTFQNRPSVPLFILYNSWKIYLL
ncbi:MAG: hypothetical protein K8R85_15090 [Bacteroidetes bacterium]|nr:hypothetical protein [Bacteroidota bacterium]